MAWTIDQVFTDEFNSLSGLIQIKNNLPTVGSGTVKDSAYSYTIGQSVWCFGRALSASSAQIRINYHLYYTSIGNNSALCEFIDSAGDVWSLRITSGTDLHLYKNTVSQGSATLAAVGLTTSTWLHISVCATASTGGSGVFTVYVDGVQGFEVGSMTTAAVFDGAYLGGMATAWSIGVTGWIGFVDNAYVELGGGADAHAPDDVRVFALCVPDAAGTNAQWDSTGTNYVAVQTDDGATSFNSTSVTAKVDTHNVGALTVPSGFAVSAVHKAVIAKRTGSTEQIKLTNYDGTNTLDSAALDLGSDWDLITSRQVTQADGVTAWSGDGTEINAVGQEFGYTSSI